jgi:hypothetical protein
VTSSRISVAASIAACLLLLIAFITSPAPFLHDFGLWLYQGKVIALKFIDPDQVAAYSLYNYPVPYVLVQYMMAALMLVLSPFVAVCCREAAVVDIPYQLVLGFPAIRKTLFRGFQSTKSSVGTAGLPRGVIELFLLWFYWLSDRPIVFYVVFSTLPLQHARLSDCSL